MIAVVWTFLIVKAYRRLSVILKGDEQPEPHQFSDSSTPCNCLSHRLFGSLKGSPNVSLQKSEL